MQKEYPNDIKQNKSVPPPITGSKDKVGVVHAKKRLDIGKIITMRTHPSSAYIPAHTHDFIELCYMHKGQTTHIINGKKLILNEGETLILNQHTIQEILPASKNDVLLNFIILPQFFSRPLEMLGEEETPMRRFILDCIAGRENTNGYLYFKTADVMPIQNLFKNLIYSFEANVPNNRIIEFTLGLLLLEFINHSDKLVSETKEKSAVLQTLKYIEENYQSGTLSDIAEQLHYDLRWLSRKVKNKTGKTFIELMQEKRLSRAEYLLKQSNIKIADIAASVGYNNMSYFHRIFKEKFGMSPKKYRDSIKKIK